MTANFRMKRYGLSSTYVPFDILLNELMPFIQNPFSGIVTGFHIRSYRSRSTLVKDVLLVQSYCPKKALFKIRIPDFSSSIPSECLFYLSY